MRRIVVVVVALALALPLAALISTGKPAGAATDRLPDLGMVKPTNIQIQNQTNGRRWLRFDTTIVNVGAGNFELRGSRSRTSDPYMSVTQHIFNSAGGHRDVHTNAVMYYAGDGHDHWHLKNLEKYTLIRLSSGRSVGTGAKQGFCFFDNYRFGSTQDPYYIDCGTDQPYALSMTMGLSRGWGDTYPWDIVGQYIDITGLSNGSYRLTAMADKANRFKESNDSNNSTWVNLKIQGNQVSVTKYGPSAHHI